LILLLSMSHILFLPLFLHARLPPLFFFTPPATSAIYTLSLHDALPISTPSAPVIAAVDGSESSIAALRTAAEYAATLQAELLIIDRKSTRLNSSHVSISYAVFCLKKKKK